MKLFKTSQKIKQFCLNLTVNNGRIAEAASVKLIVVYSVCFPKSLCMDIASNIHTYKHNWPLQAFRQWHDCSNAYNIMPGGVEKFLSSVARKRY